MTQWLLSGHNTQETTGMSRPLTASLMESDLNAQMDFMVEQLGGQPPAPDSKLRGCMEVQGLLYLNMEYVARKMATLAPVDPASLGVPAGYVTNLGKPSFIQQLTLVPRFYRMYTWSIRFYRDTLPGVAQSLRQLRKQLRAGDDLAPAWDLFKPDLHAPSRIIARAHAVVMFVIVALDGILRQQVPDSLSLFAGQSTVTSQMSQHTWELRQVAEKCGPKVCQMLREGKTDLAAYRAVPEAAPLLEALDAFLDRYGHRGFQLEFDLESERMADHPEHILLAIGGQLAEQESPQVRATAARQLAVDALEKMNPVSRALWRRIIEWGQRLIALREESKSVIALRQAAFAMAARKLAAHFYPGQADDVLLFYTIDEFLELVRSDGKRSLTLDVLDKRRAQYELHHSQPPPPEIIWYDPDTGKWTPVNEEEPVTPGVTVKRWQGIPASTGSGRVQGIALVTNDPLDAGQRLLALQGPVILVTRLTDPAWSSLFRRLSGVITELGGVISHAAIVARENGLPAIVGVAHITGQIRDGQRLRMDGKTGVIEILD